MRYYYKPLYLLLLALTITIGVFTLQMLPGGQLTNPTPENYTNPTYDEGIQGYASVASAQAGNTVKFSVSTNALSFNADIYPLGWYQGKGSRLIRYIANIPGKSSPVTVPDHHTVRSE